MSIIAKCECGNRMAVADVSAGKTLRCGKCGGPVVVPAASATPGTTARQKRAAEMPSVEISKSVIISVVVGVVLLVGVLALYFGPWTVGNKWSAMSSKANDQVTDVVGFAIKAYESTNGMYDPGQSHHEPMADGPCAFVPPYMTFSLPRRIIFTGMTNQGIYKGTYDTTDGEIIADIEIGGATVGGVETRKGTDWFHITGREKDSKVEAEVDGKPLQIVFPKTHGRDE